MRVCYVVSTYPRAEDDPEVPWLRQTVRHLRASGVEVEVFAPAYQGLRSHRIEGVPVHRFRYFPRRWEVLTHNEGATNKVQRTPLYAVLALFYILFGALAMRRFSRRYRFDVFEAHWPFPHALFAWIGARRQGAGLSLRFYGAELMLADRLRPVRPFLRFFMRRAHRASAISTFTADRARRICARQMAIIPYGSSVPVGAQEGAAPGAGLGSDARQGPPARSSAPPDGSAALPRAELLFVGRLVERKGVEYLVRALPLVRQQGIDAHLTVVGSGHREKEIRQAMEQAGAGDMVTLAGRVSEEEKIRLYRACDAYVHPAIVDAGGDTEMLGVVLIEAMAYRKPVIATEVGGIPDVIQDGETGVLVPQKDPQALAAAIVRVLREPALARRLGQAGYQRARDYFSWARITAQLTAEYRASSTAGRG
ncbi:MAG: glycosyltransferase family 4 protein [Candidatus Latescibacterota bacterium]